MKGITCSAMNLIQYEYFYIYINSKILLIFNYDFFKDSYKCACVDCDSSCPFSSPPALEDPDFEIWDMNGVTVIIALTLLIGGLIGILFGIVFGRTIHLGEFPIFLGGFEEVNVVLSRFFKWWGRSMFVLFKNCV